MLSRIKEEHLQAIPVPVESRTLRDELSSARSHVLELISRHLWRLVTDSRQKPARTGFIR